MLKSGVVEKVKQGKASQHIKVLDCASAKNKEMFITGDFNFDLLDTLYPKSATDLKGTFSSFNFTQLTDKL